LKLFSFKFWLPFILVRDFRGSRESLASNAYATPSRRRYAHGTPHVKPFHLFCFKFELLFRSDNDSYYGGSLMDLSGGRRKNGENGGARKEE